MAHLQLELDQALSGIYEAVLELPITLIVWGKKKACYRNTESLNVLIKIAQIPKWKETDKKGKNGYWLLFACRISPVTCHLSLTPTARKHLKPQ